MVVDNINEEYGHRSTQNLKVNKKTKNETGTQYDIRFEV